MALCRGFFSIEDHRHQMPTIEKQILIDKIKKINQPEAVRKFLGLLHELIEVVNLPNGSKKIAFTISRTSSKITAFINAHAALQLTGRKEKAMIGVIFKSEVLQRSSFANSKIEFDDPKTSSKYVLGQISFENRHLLDNQTIVQAWTDCLAELEDTASASQYYAGHNSFLYKIAENEALRQEFYREAFPNKKYETKTRASTISESETAYLPTLTIPKNLIFYGPPGTGKTHKVQELSTTYPHRFITFHQSYSYEEFVEGIRPETVGEQLRYKVRKGIFYEACLEALRLAGYADMESCLSDSIENRSKRFKNAAPFLLIIDEINRANISKVLGELISLIEPSKRLGAEHELSLTLSYSQSNFGIPQNLYIIGTMNSSDRSTALLDVALRRRFMFEEMQPDYALLNFQVEKTSLNLLLKTINERIAYLLDSQHIIGHAYFLTVQTFEDLCLVFAQQIIPLLQEYFYDDWHKIRLVLGDNKAHQKVIEAQFVQIQKEYTPALEKQLFAENLDYSETLIIYQINPLLVQQNYDQLPRNMFELII